MRFKKLLLGLGITAVVATPLACLLVVASNPRTPTASNTYLMNFEAPSSNGKNTVDKNNELSSGNNTDGNFCMSSYSNSPEGKQNYINNLKKQVEEVFSQYKKLKPNFKGLQLDYINLKTSPTPGEVSFFLELDKALKAINNNLSFNMIQRSPSSIQQGFYQKNADMISMYWSPDYNDLGTWLTYMFSDSQVANMWPAIAGAINKDIPVPNETSNVEHQSWVENLKNFIKSKNFGFNDTKGNFVPLIDENGKAIQMNKLMEYINNGVSSSLIYSTLGNAMAAWSDSDDVKKYGGTLEDVNDPNVYKDKLYKSFSGGIKDFQASMQTNMLDFLTSYRQNIPFIQDGPDTKNAFLVKSGAHVPSNANAADNYRDWYYQDGIYSPDGTFIDWSENNPFVGTVTPLNPSFTKSTNETLFNSTNTPLFSWSTSGDFYNEDSNYKSNYKDTLNANGALATPKDLEKVIDSGFTESSGNIKCGTDKNGKYVDIPIRPIPWVNYQGKTTNNEKFLSPEDYWAGFKGYKRSVDVKMTMNGYFIDLIGLNINATLNYQPNKERNESLKDHKTFRMYFDNPVLSGSDIVDILTKPSFCALPAFSDLVQNITDDKKFNAIANTSESNGVLNTSTVDMSKFYGCGYGPNKNVWSNMWYSSPYYVSEINDQRIIYSLNEKYFGQSRQNPGIWEDVKNDPNYVNYFLDSDMTMTLINSTTGVQDETQDVKIRKFKTIKTTYSAAYNVQLAFEQFKTGELDRSKIPPANLPSVYNSKDLAPQLYEPTTLKVKQSNLIPYNLQVYQLDKHGTIQLYDSNNNPVPFNTDNVSMDKYGNYIFNNGVHPRIKSKITDGYYDLIVKNFYTPIDAKDKDGKLLPAIDRSSAIIRTAINDCINWFALGSIVQNGKTQIIQNSFLPYGVANLSDNLTESRLTYWSLAIYKVSCSMNEKDELPGNRFGGMVEWTWPEYIDVWKHQLKGEK